MTQDKRKSNQAKYKKETYEFYKARGICTACHHEWARRGRNQCADCAGKRARREYDRRKTGALKDTPASLAHKVRRKELLVAFGVCVRCGQRDAWNGTQMCGICAAKRRDAAIRRERLKGVMPRSIMGNGEYCYFCGKPTENGAKKGGART